MKKHLKKYRGFTLLELMVTLAVAAVLLTTGIPSFVGLMKDNRLTAQVNEFVAAVTLARSEAIKRGVQVRVTSVSGANDWSGGWRVWVDLNSNNSFDDTGESIQFKQDFAGPGTTFTSTQSEYVFGSRGSSNLAGAFTLCDDRSGETGKQINIGLVGRVTLDSSYPCS